MSRKGIERMVQVFSQIQQARNDILELGTAIGVDKTGRQSHQDILLSNLCRDINDFAKDKFMEIIEFAPKQD